MEKVKLVLMASGNGTDAEAIIQAWKNGSIPEVGGIVLISTKETAGCFEMAKKYGVRAIFADYAKFGATGMEEKISKFFLESKVDLIFLVGCMYRVLLSERAERIKMYNVHPADIRMHGGDGMYGLAVHRHVLFEILDRLRRGKIMLGRPIFTYPTVHEAARDYDSGDVLLQGAVEIPEYILKDLLHNKMSLEDGAKALRQKVLPYEHLMLPTAVRMAAKKILDQR